MASGKKGKTKWKTVNLTDMIDPNIPRKPPSSSWADEADEAESSYSEYNRKPAEKIVLPSAPRAARDIDSDLKIPREPPFQAYISNLPYDVTEEELTNFFADFKIKNVRLPREERISRDERSKIKGFGYVEFEERSEFVDALRLGDTTLKGRRMKIEVAQEHDSNQGGRGRRGGDRGGDPDRSNSDWRAGPRIDDRERDGYRRNTNRREYGGSGFTRRDGDGGGGFSDRNWDQRGSDRGGGGGYRDREGDRGGFRDGDRGGGYRERDSDRSWFRDKEGDRGFNRDRDERSDISSERSWRREPDREREPESSAEPKTRPKLKLQPRTKPPEEIAAVVKEEIAPAPTAPVASIFGGARPVDTAAREREIEERLSKQKEDKFDDLSKTKIGSKDVDPPPPRDPSVPRREDAQSPINKSIEPAPPPKENAWSRRPQPSSQVNNGRLSPQDDSESNKPSRDDRSSERRSNRDASSGSDSQKKYQPPRRQQDSDQRRPRSREDQRPARGGDRGPPRGPDTKSAAPSKSRDPRKDVDDVSKMPKLQEHRAPNFAGSNKFAYLEDSSEASAD